MGRPAEEYLRTSQQNIEALGDLIQPMDEPYPIEAIRLLQAQTAEQVALAAKRDRDRHRVLSRPADCFMCNHPKLP